MAPDGTKSVIDEGGQRWSCPLRQEMRGKEKRIPSVVGVRNSPPQIPRRQENSWPERIGMNRFRKGFLNLLVVEGAREEERDSGCDMFCGDSWEPILFPPGCPGL